MLRQFGLHLRRNVIVQIMQFPDKMHDFGICPDGIFQRVDFITVLICPLCNILILLLNAECLSGIKTDKCGFLIFPDIIMNLHYQTGIDSLCFVCKNILILIQNGGQVLILKIFRAENFQILNLMFNCRQADRNF